MGKRLLPIIIMLLCVTSACKSKVEKTVTGDWTIDTLVYQGYEIKSCLLVNWIRMKKDGSLALPIPEDRCAELVTEYNRNGNWKITSNDSVPFLLEIDSRNTIFRGEYRIFFRGDTQEGLLKMDIQSDSTRMICRKMMFDFDRQRGLVRELERLSTGQQ